MTFKKIVIITIIIFGLPVLPFFNVNWSFIRTSVFADTPNIAIYKDQLQSNFVNWSWGSSVDLQKNSPVQEGSASIAFTPSGWGGLYLHTDTAIDLNQYEKIHFYLNPTNQLQLNVLIYNENNETKTNLSLSKYLSSPAMNSWNEVSVPVSDILPTTAKMKGFALQDATGNGQSILYVDNIELIAKAVSTPAPTGASTITPTTAPSITLTVAPTTVPTTSTSPTQSTSVNNGNPLSGVTFFNNPDSNPAAIQANEWNTSRTADAATIRKIADQPKAIWMGGWSGDIKSTVQNIVDKAASMNSLPIFISYNIPFRDCGSFSAGGSSTAQAYSDWIQNFANGIGNKKALIVLEPDALAGYTCLPQAGQQERLDLLKKAIQTFKGLGNTLVYLDAGHAGWIAPNDMADRLKKAGVDKADGFSVNVSNFDTTDTSISYGQQISGQIGGKHFIIDTSRNGNGPAANNEWCNPAGRAIGVKPTTQTGNSQIDGFLWLKYPGESDGNCNGGPSAGTWYPEYALGLAQRASW